VERGFTMRIEPSFWESIRPRLTVRERQDKQHKILFTTFVCVNQIQQKSTQLDGKHGEDQGVKGLASMMFNGELSTKWVKSPFNTLLSVASWLREREGCIVVALHNWTFTYLPQHHKGMGWSVKEAGCKLKPPLNSPNMYFLFQLACE